MKEIRGLAIKLFGKEISLPDNDRNSIVSGEEDDKLIEAGDEDSKLDNFSQIIEEYETLDNLDDPKIPPTIEDNGNEKAPNTDNEEMDQKSLKKPDKILSCPRCNSMDTKFCYYNNYNVSQPRHFCKACHRYWTAGGSMRNIPVGAGRRKNKNSSSNFRQITISEDPANKVISFVPSGAFQNVVFGADNDNESACSSGSSVITTSNSIEGSKLNNFNNQIPCLQGYPWTYSPIPTLCPPGYPISVYPIPYWVHWVPPHCGTNQNLSNEMPNLPLGKHSRNGELITKNTFENTEFVEPKSCESPILTPKTLRIDDLGESAKSSVWSRIKSDLIDRKSIFKGFELKCDEKKNDASERPSSMRANPAAMSRSINFVEST